MIKKCEKIDEKILLDYIGDEYYKCLYLYLDYLKYGLSNDNIKVFIQKNDEKISALVLKYYSGMHIYSKNFDCDFIELCDLIKNENPSAVCAERKIIQKLEEAFNNSLYESEYGWVRCLDKKFECNNEKVEVAQLDELEDVAKIVMQDPDIANSYSFENLYNQIKERNIEKYGRNYIIRENGEIIAHASTGAESDKVAVLSYVITNEKYRGRGLATKVCSKLCNDVIDEGKKVYLINYTNESTALYDKLGFEIACEWGKLYRKED